MGKEKDEFEREKILSHNEFEQELRKMERKKGKSKTNPKVNPQEEGYKLRKGIREGFGIKGKWDMNK